MIAELFYPKKLKEIIRKLEAYGKGTAINAVIQRVKYRIYRSILITYEIEGRDIVKTIRLSSVIENYAQLKGKTLIFYCLHNGYGMPDIAIMKYYFCLRKDFGNLLVV